MNASQRISRDLRPAVLLAVLVGLVAACRSRAPEGSTDAGPRLTPAEASRLSPAELEENRRWEKLPPEEARRIAAEREATRSRPAAGATGDVEAEALATRRVGGDPAPEGAGSPVDDPRLRNDCREGAPLGCMIRMAGGPFRVGAQKDDPKAPNYLPDARPDERPYDVVLRPYWIHQSEVPARHFAACVRANGCRAGDVSAEGGFFNFGQAGRDELPANGVTWAGARDFCRWIGARLPTEPEWEFAARGGTWRRYPWGDGPPECPIAWWKGGCGKEGTGRPNPVGGPLGGVGFAGNVWEWTADAYAADVRKRPKNEAETADRVQRGGAWTSDDPAELRTTHRARMAPGLKLDDVGFRCVRDDG